MSQLFAWGGQSTGVSAPFRITVIQIYAPTNNAKEAEAEWFYEHLQEL